jgi:hypothetical protein
VRSEPEVNGGRLEGSQPVISIFRWNAGNRKLT